MNISELKGNWNKYKGKFKQSFAILTDNNAMHIEGKKNEIIGTLQIKLSKNKVKLREVNP